MISYEEKLKYSKIKINRQDVYNKYDKHCAYCGKVLETIKDMQVDHKTPRCYNGFMVDNRFDNLNPSCRSCNHYKRSSNVEGFRKTMITLHERIKKIYINKVGIDFNIITITPFDGKFYFEKL
jgi:5-methylcytosine-specific restriction endonuclease McrA